MINQNLPPNSMINVIQKIYNSLNSVISNKILKKWETEPKSEGPQVFKGLRQRPYNKGRKPGRVPQVSVRETLKKMSGLETHLYKKKTMSQNPLLAI